MSSARLTGQKRARVGDKRGGARRVRPSQVTTHTRHESGVKINTMRQLLSTEPHFPLTANGPATHAAVSYIKQCQRVMAGAIRSYVETGGALNPAVRRGQRRRAVTIAHNLSTNDLKQLRLRRNEWLEYLKKHINMLLRAPPSSGGETARWTPGTGLWLLVCHAHCVLRHNGVGAAMLDEFAPSRSRYLTRNQLVLSALPVPQYPLSLLVATISGLLERLELLDGYDRDLVLFVNALQYRCAAFVCGSGTWQQGFDAPQWLEPLRTAHSGKKQSAEQRTASAAESCTTDFVCESMIWFVTMHHFIDTHHLLDSFYAPLDATATARERREAELEHGDAVVELKLRSSVEQTRAMRWMPNAGMRARVRQFFYDYASSMKDDRYEFALRSFVLLFAPLPGDSDIYRLRTQSDVAIPRNILNTYIAHQSPTGSEFMRQIMCATPVISWLHDEANWRAGDASVRSASLGRYGFFRQLALLFAVHMYFSGPKFGVRFRHRFVLFQRSPSFFTGYTRAKRNGWPFIVQQFGLWTVVVPHRKDPASDVLDLERSLETLSTRDAHATERLALDMERQAAADARRAALDEARVELSADDFDDLMRDAESDDDDGSYSYSYSYETDDDERSGGALSESDDEADLQRALFGGAGDDEPDDALARELARMTLEVEECDTGNAFDIERTRTYGESAPPMAATDAFLRTYDCETFFDAFALWAVALLHCNDGRIDDKNLTDFFVGLFGWHVVANE